ncbi:hypothetical protein CC56_2194 [Bordetella pertussis H934]|nr:hypothetical protein L567_2139 [Bordetella pertussis STO1-CHLA-0006]ETH95609.1 hypothetical protein L562_2121 [Bordetella pertussis STO1-CHOC-0021]KCV26314.1 hypothetical protein CC56_2194 [Bordetella pertussis H934]
MRDIGRIGPGGKGCGHDARLREMGLRTAALKPASIPRTPPSSVHGGGGSPACWW